MLRNTAFPLFCCLFFLVSCQSDAQQSAKKVGNPPASKRARYFAGAISNGMKGDSINFILSADGKQLSELNFKGYWRCAGKLESTLVGPEGSFPVVNGIAKGHITEPPNGGSTAWRFEIDAKIQGNTASGTFRMNINNLGCDTYVLKWTAAARK